MQSGSCDMRQAYQVLGRRICHSPFIHCESRRAAGSVDYMGDSSISPIGWLSIQIKFTERRSRNAYENTGQIAKVFLGVGEGGGRETENKGTETLLGCRIAYGCYLKQLHPLTK